MIVLHKRSDAIGICCDKKSKPQNRKCTFDALRALGAVKLFGKIYMTVISIKFARIE